MTEYCNEIISKAFRSIPGNEYNQVLGEYFEETPDNQERELIYEVVLSDENPWEDFRDKTYPLFVRYLKSRSFNPVNPCGVVIAAFYNDKCYFLEATEFVSLFAGMEGLDPSGLRSRVKQWLSE